MSAPAPMSVDEREAKEAEEFSTGPLSVLTTSVKTNSQVGCPVQHSCQLDLSARLPGLAQPAVVINSVWAASPGVFGSSAALFGLAWTPCRC